MIKVKRYVNEKLNSNSYLIYIEDSCEAYMVDCGDVDDIKKDLNTMNKRIKSVFVTHTHYDHIYGLNNLLSYFPNIIVYTSNDGVDGLKSDRRNLSKYHEDSFIYNGTNIVALNNEDIIKLYDSFYITAHYTPGHDISSMIFALNNHALFTGDSFIPNTKTVTHFPLSNKHLETESSKFIGNIINDFKIVFPGHNEELVNKDNYL